MLETYAPILWGSLSGLALGMTGGGGSVIAVPILIYGLGLPIHSAIAVSLFSVAVTTFCGSLEKFIGRDPNLDWKAGLILAFAGLALAPVGTKIGSLFSPTVLMLLFSLLMLFIGVRTWLKTVKKSEASKNEEDGGHHLPALIGGGVTTGLLSGFLGVGGGFLIVPALGAAGLPVKKAVTTSLLAITIISASGAISHFVQNPDLNLALGFEFAIGGVVGLNIGMQVVKSISSKWVSKIFAIFVILVAIGMLIEKLVK
ncbi:MAG: sulfite exporter TauE/SafE family protein [Desulfobulbaceae bacterium]|nr:sulfite exporter TauE/SafE family protein [Desulfobulbaceae bacterium]